MLREFHVDESPLDWWWERHHRLTTAPTIQGLRGRDHGGSDPLLYDGETLDPEPRR